MQKPEKYNRSLLRVIKKCIGSGLDEKVNSIAEGKTHIPISILSKKDFFLLIRSMDRHRTYPISLLKYIYFNDMFIKKIDKTSHINCMIASAGHYGNLDIIKFILSDDMISLYPGIGAGGSYCNEAIQGACEKGHIDVVKFLLSPDIVLRFPDIDPGLLGNYCLQVAFLSSRLEIIKFLLSPDTMSRFPSIDLSECGDYILRSAVVANQVELVEFLLSQDIVSRFPAIDPSANNNVCLDIAIQKNFIEIVIIMLSDKRVISADRDIYKKHIEKALNANHLIIAHILIYSSLYYIEMEELYHNEFCYWNERTKIIP